MEESHISNFFKKFLHLKPPERVVKEMCIEVVHTISNITLIPENISVHKNTLYITTSSVKKSELFLHKEKILEALREKLPTSQPITDIR